MFETAEIGHKVGKGEYQEKLEPLRTRLLQAQMELRDANVPTIVIVSGADGAGTGDTVRRLTEWLDPRGLETSVFGSLTDEERERPPFWRFWRTLPAKGRIGIFFGSWYTDPIIGKVYGHTRRAAFDVALGRIAFFERMLVEEGALVIKFWLHLGKKAQRRRLRALERSRRTRFRVSPIDWKHFKLYDKFVKVSERALRLTDTSHAPWHVIDATDDRYRELTVGTTVLEAIHRRLGERAMAPPAPAAPQAPRAGLTILDRVALEATLTDKEYEKKLAVLQAKVGALARAAWERKRSSILVFEGWDAAGKGGAIRRLTEAMDARLYRVVPIAAPTDEERAQHYLWRFWRHVPRAGRVTIYDRSWYGRVLVERVEGFAREPEWRRSYLEINDFEEQLLERGIVLVKFFIHISKDEQLRRFEERRQTERKKHKITDEDWRNRAKWDHYEAAVSDMVERTSTVPAPWTIVAGNDKRFARIQILETFRRALARSL